MSTLNITAESFDARVILANGVQAYISAPTMADLADVMGRLRPVAAATSTKKATTPGKPAAGAATDPAGSPASATAGSSAQAAAGAAAGEAGNASASTGTQASAQAAAGGSAASGGDQRTDEELLKAVGERVSVLAKKSRELAKGELKKFMAVRNGEQTKFPVERGGELTREQRIQFLANTEALVL